jgi:protein-tyrosine kinase
MAIIEDTLNRLHEQVRARAASPAEIVRVDHNALRAAGLLPPQGQARELSEQFRQIKRPLIASATGRCGTRIPSGHLIMVSSAVPGEGKTFTCINLAVSIAFEKDTRVLLVDADVAKPQISRLLGLGSKPGLLDALRDSTLDIDALILPTDMPGFSVLPAGQPVEHTTELLASARMQHLAHQIGERDAHRVALFDSPPLLLTSESIALAQALGQVLLVVRAGVTPQQSVLDAVERLGGGKPLSVVLNQSIATVREGSKVYGPGMDRRAPTTA